MRAALVSVVLAIGLTNCGSDRAVGGGDAGDGCASGVGCARHPRRRRRRLRRRFEAATVVVAPDGGTAPHPYEQPLDTVDNGLTIAAAVADGIKPQGYREVQAAAACNKAAPAMHARRVAQRLPRSKWFYTLRQQELVVLRRKTSLPG